MHSTTIRRVDAPESIRLGTPGPLAAWIAPWREAWLALPDNPLAANLKSARRRALKAIPWWKRHAFTLLILTIGLVVALMIVAINVTAGFASGRPLQETITAIEWSLVWAAAVMVFPVYAAWLLEGLFAAVVDALAVLGRQSRQSYGLIIDDMLAITAIGHREIVLGVLSNLMPPLLRRIAVGAVLAPVTVIVALGISNINQSVPVLLDQHMLNTLLAAPFSALVIMLQGGLAALCGLLYMLGLGRGLQTGSVTSSAGVIVSLTQLAMIPASLGLAAIPLSGLGSGNTTIADHFRLGGAIFLVAPLLLWLGLMLARNNQVFRYILAVGTPPLVVGLLASAAVFGSSLASHIFNDQAAGMTFIGCISSWFSLATVNLTSLVLPIFAAIGNEIASDWKDLLIIGTVVIAQLAAQACLVVLLASFAADAVRLRRCQEA